MQKKIFFVLLLLFTIYIIFFLFAGSTKVAENLTVSKDEVAQDYAVKNYAVEIPEKLDFAGESVPLERLDVREGLDRELLVNTYWHSQTFLFFKRANRYFPIIEPVLKRNNVPDDFKYLSLIESGFTNVISPSGAIGFWQMLKASGEKWGLVINDEIDERYHVEKSTEAACRYLKNSFSFFNNWTLAAAAYNMGDSGLSNQIKAQKTSNYYDLYLNSETARYIYRILAVKIIFQNPHKYGFYFNENDLYPFVKTEAVAVDSSINDLPQFALDKGINYKILKEYNPWLRKPSLTNKTKKTYIIQIPRVEELNYKYHFPKNDSLR